MSTNVMRRKSRAVSALITAGITVALSLGTTSMAMAVDEPAGDETIATAQVETPSVEEVVATEPENTPVEEPTPEVVKTEDTAPVVEEVAPVVEEPAPVEDIKSEPVVEESTPVSPVQGPPAESVETIAPATVKTELELTKVYPAILLPLGCAADEEGSNPFLLGADGNGTLGVDYDVDVDGDGNAFVAAAAQSGNVATLPEGSAWVVDPETGAIIAYFTGTVDVTALINENCNNEPPCEEPEIVTGTAEFQTLSCTEGSKNWAKTDIVSGGIWTFTQVGSGPFATELGTGYDGGIPEGQTPGVITVTLTDGDETDAYNVTPWSGVWTTVDPASLKCNTTPPVDPPVVTDPVVIPPVVTPPVVAPVVQPVVSEVLTVTTPKVRTLAATGSNADQTQALITASGALLVLGALMFLVSRRRKTTA